MEIIGFIGLGIMGAPMAGHLLDAGYSVVTSDHRGAPRADLVAKGLKAVTGSRAVAKAADIIITVVPDTPDVADVLFNGDDSVAAGLSKGKLVIDMGSISPIEGAPEMRRSCFRVLRGEKVRGKCRKTANYVDTDIWRAYNLSLVRLFGLLGALKLAVWRAFYPSLARFKFAGRRAVKCRLLRGVRHRIARFWDRSRLFVSVSWSSISAGMYAEFKVY